MAAMTRWKSRPAINGIRVYDADGAPLDPDNSTVVRERISLEKADPNIPRHEITTIDDALTRPWMVTRTYRRHTSVRRPMSISARQ